MNLDIKLQSFEGPLELLLHLVDKNKVSIMDIPIVDITKQYLEYINKMQDLDIEIMSEFLVMASTLLNIKSKMLLPDKKEKVEEKEDPRADLIKRLMEYKMFKYAGQELKSRQDEENISIVREKNIPKEIENFVEEVNVEGLFSEIDIKRLNEIFKSIMKRNENKVDKVRSKFGKIEKEEVSVEKKMKEIHNLTKGLKNINFRILLKEQATKVDIVVTFLAILELMKVGKVKISQNNLFDDIIIDGV